MNKRVAARCEKCNDEFTVIRKNLNATCTCRKCTFALVPRGNYAQGIEKRKRTNIKKFGSETPPRTEEWEANRTKALRDRYGGNSALCDPTVLAKMKATNMERYKAPWSVATLEVREKAETSMLNNHGVRFSRQSPVLQAKAVETLVANYGVTNPGAHPDLKERALATTLERFGTLNMRTTGEAENEVRLLVEEITGEPAPNTIIPGSRLEIDCFVEGARVGVEYCGLYYHCEEAGNEDPRVHARHRAKLDAANAAGIRLITLFEDEWLSRRAQVEGVLRVILGNPASRVAARSCALDEINADAANTFFGENHIIGPHAKIKRAWVLTRAGEAVAAASVSHNYAANSRDTVVLQRLCFKRGVHVQGGASRLLATIKRWAATEGYQAIVSFSDNRWSRGDLYAQLNFKCVKDTGYDYGYVDFTLPARRRVRLSKQTQQKHRVGCPPDRTERQWAEERGLRRIWDCGHKHWRLALQ